MCEKFLKNTIHFALASECRILWNKIKVIFGNSIIFIDFKLEKSLTIFLWEEKSLIGNWNNNFFYDFCIDTFQNYSVIIKWTWQRGGFSGGFA